MSDAPTTVSGPSSAQAALRICGALRVTVEECARVPSAKLIASRPRTTTTSWAE
ncbi:hypothetical protein [Porphyrobacter sp. AAP82]|uniref:hypothetical protein n=1 Tax=Porphyrobacter sp. AAP82 TaxID=1248917 RepID=UPI000360C6AD|nr:hypothetical protein [Porphyrobacter sp. AAP82]